jgi:predicted nucleotidyltransferase
MRQIGFAGEGSPVYDTGMTVREQILRANVRVPPQILEEAVRRIVDVADPERIILFGSAARSEIRAGSDLDLLVIKESYYDYHRVITEIYAALAKLDWSVDVVLVTAQQVERYRHSFCLVIHPALKEGNLIYEREAVPAR